MLELLNTIELSTGHDIQGVFIAVMLGTSAAVTGMLFPGLVPNKPTKSRKR